MAESTTSGDALSAEALASIERIVAGARALGRTSLLETEALDVARTLGFAVPGRILVESPEQAARTDLTPLAGDRLVVKVLSAEILHKTEVGGVEIVPREPAAVRAAIERMQHRCAGKPIEGYTLNEYVPHDREPGSELLLGMRWTEEFGPVVTLGLGGVLTEFLSARLRPGEAAAVFSPGLARLARLEPLLRAKAVGALLLGGVRAQAPRIELDRLRRLLGRLLEFAQRAMPHEVEEFELNPVVPAPDGPIALDALFRLGRRAAPRVVERPLAKLQHLLQPRSVAIIGVSEELNPGRIILRNIIREGFARERIHVVKPGRERIDGCRCWPDIASLPERVDLLVVGVGAEQAPEVLRQVLAGRKAETVILIPGGLGERRGTEALADRMREAIEESRREDWRGPLVNGGNCLGIRSRPGRYDTMFIPEAKLPRRREPPAPLAVISQSGALSVAKASKLAPLEPRYLISVGNQIDLSQGDYLRYLADDEEIQVFACYVEGFRPLDGLRWLRAAERISASGRTVILYRAGRTASGARASASHTAVVAGDYAVTRELARSAGVLVAESLSDFEDFIRLACLLDRGAIRGRRLAALSNAGYECVTLADNLGPFRLAEFGRGTVERISDLLRRRQLDRIVSVHNPLDLNPLLDDAAFEEAVRIVLEDDGFDAAIVGCVPLTGALNTLERGERHGEDILRVDSVVSRLVRLRRLPKPWVAVVDAGPLYDAMARRLEAGGIPTFRSADRALRLFGAWCAHVLGLPG